MADVIFEELFDDEKALEYLKAIEKQLTQTGQVAEETGTAVAKSVDGVTKSETLLEKAIREEQAAEEARAKKRADNAAKFKQQEEEAARRYEEHLKQLDIDAQKTAQVARQVAAAQKANQSWLQSIRQTVTGQQIAGKTLGEWVGQARGFVGRIGEAATKIPGVNLAVKGFGAALKAVGIGGVIGLLTGFVGSLFKVQSVADKVSQVMAGVNAVISVLANRVVLLGSAVVKVFSGDFAGAANDASAAVSGIASELANAAIQAANLEARLQALRDVTITQSVEAARQRVEIERLRSAVDDGTKSINERSAAARRAGELETQLARQAVDRALEAQQIAQEKFLLDKNSLAAREEAAQAEIAFQEAVINLNKTVSDAEKEQREFRKEAAEERRKAQEEELKRVEALRKEYDKLFSSIVEQADQLEIENIFNPVDRVIAEFERSKAQINQLRERLLEIAPDAAARQRVEDEVERLFEQLLIKYREEYSAAADELEKLKALRVDEFSPLPPLETLRRDISGTLESLRQSATEFIEGQQPLSIAELLGLSPDQLEGLKTATAQVIDSLSQIAEARVKEAEAASRAAQERVQSAEEALEREQELAAEGLANNTDLARQELERQKELRDEALKEEAKARRSQILLDSVSQISSLITASANIFKSLSTIPFAGIPLAIATIATMFGAFAKAKADALKSASVPKFRKGTKLDGRSHEEGGLAISDEYGNVVGEAEGGEWLIGTKPSKEHDAFLQRLNRGEFAGVDLNRLVPRPTESNPLYESARRIEQVEQQRREMQGSQHFAAMVAAYKESAGEIVQAIKQKPDIYPTPDGYIEARQQGRTRVKNRVRFKE